MPTEHDPRTEDDPEPEQGLEATAVDLALEATQRGVESQEKTLGQLRERAVKPVTLATAVAAFLGFKLGGDDAAAIDLWGAFVILSFVVVIGCAVFIDWPREWSWHLSAEVLLGDAWLGRDVSRTAYRRDYTEALEKSFDENETNLGRCFYAYRIALVALGAEVAALLMTLADGWRLPG